MPSNPPRRIFSGVQPTGDMHVGNYLGALKRFAALQETFECVFCLVDLHAITVEQPPDVLADNTRRAAAALLAAGVDPDRALIYVQSALPIHAELAWILGCMAPMGWLERMTQFKDKAGKDKTRASVGLFSYPVLQAADILAFRATHVPVGEDQKQHIELARDIAERFNRYFDAPDFFPLPEPLIGGSGARVMSLKDGSKKMSKSTPSAFSRIDLGDDADLIVRKIRKAKTDSAPLPGSVEGLSGRPEATNLVGLYAALSDWTPDAVLARFGGEGFSSFKPELAELAVSKLVPVSESYVRFMRDPAQIDAIVSDGAERARAISEPIRAEIRELVGFWPGSSSRREIEEE